MSLHSMLRTDQSRMRSVFIVLVGLIAVCASFPLFAGPGPVGEPDWWIMGMQLFGGFALFLFGMEQMADALKAVAGDHMKLILARLPPNRFIGAATGAFVTGVVQSSSLITVLLVGFITAGLMSLSQTIGIMMGANIGTTLTAQIVAFKVTKGALLMVGLGFSMLSFSGQDKIKQYGAMIMGLGLLFFGMSVMGDAMQPLRTLQPFLDLMIDLENPLLGILIGALLTGLIRSSSAMTGIVIVVASQGLITLPAGIALAFGANIGTCITVILGTMDRPRIALRVALVHVAFNLAGVLLWAAFIMQLAEFVTWFSPSYPELSGIDRLAAETPRQIANAHTIFNIANTLIFIWFTHQIARLVAFLVPASAMEEEGLYVASRYLDEELLSTPSLALDRVRLEVLHMGEEVDVMLDRIMPAILLGDRASLAAIKILDDQVDVMYEQIIDYMGQISKSSMADAQTTEFLKLMEAVNDLENVGDTVETNLVALGNDAIDRGVSISRPTAEVLSGFQEVIRKALKISVQAVSQNNEAAARLVLAMKDEVSSLVDSAIAHEARRLVTEEPNRISTYTIEMDIIENQKRIYYFAKRMSKSVLL